MFEERVFVRVDQLELLAAQLGHEMRQPVGEGPAQVDEFGPTALAGHWLDNYLRGVHGAIPSVFGHWVETGPALWVDFAPSQANRSITVAQRSGLAFHPRLG